MTDNLTSHVVYCRSCQKAWISLDISPMELDNPTRAAVDDCACVCTDDQDAPYEDWVVDPDPAEIPEGAWING